MQLQLRASRTFNTHNFVRAFFAATTLLLCSFEFGRAADVVEPIELSTPSFKITVLDRCEAGTFFCKDVTYIGINKKTGKKNELKGQAMVRFCADGKTPCEHTGYLFSDGQTMYEITRDDWLIVSDGATGKVLVKEKGERARQVQ